MKSKKLINSVKEVVKINDIIPEYPYIVWNTLIGKRFKPRISGEEILLAPDADYTTIDKAQEAVAYLVEQLGGKVTWEK